MMIRLRNDLKGSVIIGMAAIACLLLVPLVPATAAITSPGRSPQLQNPKTRRLPASRPQTCPTTPAALTQLLLRDLPGYINRLARRNGRSGGEIYVVAASGADLTPLPVKSSESPNVPDKNLHQVFFTTLEREYDRNQMQQWQQHHWLFLAQTAQGWQLALIYSRFAPYPTDSAQPLLPARDSSQSLTAGAIRVWLRDCNAGAIRL